MEKTKNLNLNKPDTSDPLRLEDFNENADIIDAAVGAKGNCSVETGTYKGTGTYDNTSNKLTFSKQPLAVFIGGGGYNAMMIRNNSHGVSIDYNGSVRALNLTWSGSNVSWYSSANAGHQMNDSKTYTYLALMA